MSVRLWLNRRLKPLARKGIIAPKLNTPAYHIELLPLAKVHYYPLINAHHEAITPTVSLGDRVLRGQPLGIDEHGQPIHASTSGYVSERSVHPVVNTHYQTVPCLVVTTDFEDKTQTLAPVPLNTAIAPNVYLERIKQAGIVGLGGGGFPAIQKINTAHIHTLVINGVECEPPIQTDHVLMQIHAKRIIQGALVLQHVLQPKRIILAIEDNKPNAIRALQHATAATSIEVISLPTQYPMGAEKQLIATLTGQEIPSGDYPSHQGFLCYNVATVVAIGRAVLYGEPLTSRLTTFTGNRLSHQRHFDIRIGTPLNHVLAYLNINDPGALRLTQGGHFMGCSIHNIHAPLTAISNCIMIEHTAQTKSPEQPCIRCGDCASVCPAGLLPQQLHWFTQAKQSQKLKQQHIFDCIECGCCDAVCPSHIPLAKRFGQAKRQLQAEQEREQKALKTKQRYEARNKRLHQAATARQKVFEHHQKTLQDALQTKQLPAALQAAMARAKHSKSVRIKTATQGKQDE